MTAPLNNFGLYAPNMWHIKRYAHTDSEWVYIYAYQKKLGYWRGPTIHPDPTHPYNVSNIKETKKILAKFIARGTVYEDQGIYYFKYNPKYPTYRAIAELNRYLEEIYPLLNSNDADQKEGEALALNIENAIEECNRHLDLTDEQKSFVRQEIYEFYEELRSEMYIERSLIYSIAWVQGWLSDEDFEGLAVEDLARNLNLKVKNPLWLINTVVLDITGSHVRWMQKKPIYCYYEIWGSGTLLTFHKEKD